MKTDNTDKPSKNRKKGGFKLFSRTHSVSAHLAHERDWQTDIPDIKLSRAFVFVLLLHVVAVVGILAFEFFKPDLTMDPVAGTTAAEEELAEIERKEEKKKTRMLRDASDGYYRYTVKSGDSMDKIAARYGVTRADIERLNVFEKDKTIGLGTILRLPVSRDQAKRMEEEHARVAKMMEASNRDREQKEEIERAILSPSGDKPGDGKMVVHTDAGQPKPTTPEVFENAPPLKKLDDDFVPLSDITEPGDKPVKKEPEKKIAEKVEKTPDPKKESPKVARKLPGKDEKAPAEPKKDLAKRTYEVQSGDTFYSIGRRFGISHTKILAANEGTDPRSLRIGQVLKIPEG